MIKTATLKLNPNNPRDITPEKFGALKRSIKDFPKMMVLRPMVVDKAGTVLGGNMRLKAITELGMKEIPDDWVIRAEKLSKSEQRRFLAVDNLEYGSWTDDFANEYDLSELKDWGFDEKDLDISFDEDENLEDAEPQPDKANELQQQWKTERGQVWRLGEHRLMCGDSAWGKDVDKLLAGEKADCMFTDPPYGVSYGDKNGFLNAVSPANRIQKPIENDQLSPEECLELWTKAWLQAERVLKSGGVFYICSADSDLMMMMMMSITNAKLLLKQSLVWVKNNIVLGRRDYKCKHENILYGWKGGAGHNFYGEAGAPSVWEFDKPHSSKLHPTMKPIELVEHGIRNSSKPNEIIYEPFSGSGTCLIACEQLHRKCRAMEIDPGYVAVALQRWADATGKNPEMLK